MTYLCLALAVLAEVIATSSLKASEQFTKIIPTMIVFLGYGVAFYLLTLVLKNFPVGVTYAVWSGLGIVLVTIAGLFLYKEVPDFPAIVGMSLIVIGVLVIHIFSRTTGH